MKDFICQTSKHLSTNTPRKNNQRKVIRAQRYLSHFFRMQLKLHSQKAKGRYSPKMKSIAVSLYHASGKAYRILSKLFILPTKSSLRRYISKMPAATGISQGALNIIKKR